MLSSKNKLQDGICIKMSELLYLCFWGLMLFAKGIGLYDGQTLYKIFLVAAFLCIAAKMCITEYSLKEWGVILLLTIWSAAVYRISGEKGVLICMVTVVALKNVSMKRAFGVGLIVWSAAMGGRFLTSLLLIDGVETAMQTKNITGAVLRYFMGYPHPNVLHISYLILAALMVYCVKETYNWKHFLVLMGGNLFLFFYSYSFTGAGIVTLYLCLSLYVSKRKISKAEYFVVQLMFPICILFSIIFPLALQGKAFELADKIFNNRINYARHFLTVENITLMGNNLAEITTDIITMDNSFVFALVIYGLPVFVLICVGYMYMISVYVKQQKKIELAIVCCFLVAGITEPFLFNTSFKNLPLLFIGEQLFEALHKGKKEQKEIAVLKGQDKDIRIPTNGWQKIREQLQDLWKTSRKTILAVGLMTALLSGIAVVVFGEIRPAVVELQRDHLLAFERLRIISTVLLIGFVVGGIVAGAGCKIVIGWKNKI